MSFGMFTFADGEIELVEPYKSRVEEAKLAATKGWRDGLIDYLLEYCPYSRRRLEKELVERSRNSDEPAMSILEGFIIDAMAGEF